MNELNANGDDVIGYRQSLEHFVRDFDQVAGAVLATADGLLVAKAVRSREIEADAMAAMSASMLSLADALAGQAGRAYADKVISEAESCTLVLLHAGQLILTVVGQPNVNIGIILSAARRTAQRIEQLAKDAGIMGKEVLIDSEALLAKVRRDIREIRMNSEVES